MNAEILKTQAAFLSIYESQKKALADKSEAQLRDLLHDCEELELNETYSLRVSSHVNKAAIEMILGERKQK